MKRINFQQTYTLIRGRAVQMLDIALIITVAALLVFMTLLSWLITTSPEAQEINRQQYEYFQKIEQEQNTEAAKRALQQSRGL